MRSLVLKYYINHVLLAIIAYWQWDVESFVSHQYRVLLISLKGLPNSDVGLKQA